MAKLTLSDVTNLQNQQSLAATVNANSALIVTAMEKTLSRDGTSPNEMTADLDMNSKRILNLVDAVTNQEPVTYRQFIEGSSVVTGGFSGIAVSDKGTVTSGTVTFNWTNGEKQKLTVGGALTVAFTGWPSSGRYGEIEVQLVNGGAFTVTWPSVKWMLSDGGSSTTFADMNVSLSAAGTNFILVWSTDGGANLYGRAI